MIHQKLKQRLLQIQSDIDRPYHPEFRIYKKDVLDAAFSRFAARSVAELGCVWGIDCAYGIYVLNTYHPQKVVMVDTHWTESALASVRNHPEITVVQDSFGSASLPGQIGSVDAIILFDVLLHQVAPDWDRVLQMYAPYTSSFVIFNPQWIGTSTSVRLLDLGRDGYFANVPHSPDHPTYDALFSHMYERHPEHDRIWRDVHHVWQWGITTADVLFTLDRLGFDLVYFQNHGRSNDLDNFEDHAFVFHKRG
jgi:hypothetical protein